MSDPHRLPGEDVATWGHRTGRYPASRIPFWREKLAEERGYLAASGATPQPGPTPVEQLIASLQPLDAQTQQALTRLEAADISSLAPVRTESDEIYDAVYPTREQVWARQDASAAAQNAAMRTPLTDEEMRVLFGEDR